ncbi:chitin synthase chs-2-like [Venturia canescens]|uniref:chitin synthase chs-2-like n=1 Tax=Venturia canescens TaxID=32260 RepID=UPI001C9CB8CD|nr:chitin synthase chs-2-like [Venturia canescens]
MQHFGEQTSRLSYSPDYHDYKENDFVENEQTEGSDEEIQGWDVFKIFPPKLKTGSKADTTFFDVTARVTKLLTYFVLFALILGGGIVAKMSIIFAVAQIKNDTRVDFCDFNDAVGKPSGRNFSASVPENYRVEWYWCIVLGFASSEILGLINGIYLSLFKKQVVPRAVDILILLVIETFHTVGLALLFFLVLPELNSIQTVTVSSTTCLIPGFLAILFRNRQNYPRSKSIFLFVGDIVATLCQLCGIFIWLLPDANVKMTDSARYTLPLALLLVSCRWWGNHVSAHNTFGIYNHPFNSIQSN